MSRQITDQLWHIRDCDNTRRVSPFRPDGPEPPLRCRRFAYGYALDGSEFPCYLVWPQRDGRSYVLLDTATTDTLVLDQSFFRPLGMQHFYDSFALVSQICVRRDALVLFGLNDDELLPGAGVLRAGLGAHQEHLVNQEAQAADQTKVHAQFIRWPPMRLIMIQSRMSPLEMLVALKEVRVRVNRSRMTLPLRWPQMLNNMSACKHLRLQWAVTSKSKRTFSGPSTASSSGWRWFLSDGPSRDSPFLCKNVLTILIAC